MFAGLIPRRESDLTSTTPLESHKQLQIDSLRKHHPSVCEILKFISYRLDLITSNGQLTLDISLPPLFPQVQPIITVLPPVYHPWIDNQQKIVGCQELLAFSMNSDLGKVTLIIVEEFQKHPPMPLPMSQSHSKYWSRMSPSLTRFNGCSFGASNAVYTPGSRKTTLHLPFPQVSDYFYELNSLPSSFPDLKKLSDDDLRVLNSDDDKVQDFIENLPFMQKLSKEKEELSKINEKLAAENLSKQPLLECHKQTIFAMVNKVTSLRQEYDDYCHQHQILSDQYSPGTIQENLKFAALQAEEESEKIALEFLDGKIENEEFLLKFMEKRTLGHCRRGKEEKLQQQLMELKKSGF